MDRLTQISRATHGNDCALTSGGGISSLPSPEDRLAASFSRMNAPQMRRDALVNGLGFLAGLLALAALLGATALIATSFAEAVHAASIFVDPR